MTISCCPKCGSNNISTAGVCANCGWSLFARCVTSSDAYNPIGDMEFEAAGKALLNDYKRLLIENNSLAARIAELEGAQRWIPVGERLPEDGEVVWLWDGNNLGMGYYLVFAGQFMDRDTPLRRIKPTHWMPLPEPPEVQE